MPLQRSAQVGVLTDLSYVQLVGEGVASIDVGFPMRHSHSANEMCDLSRSGRIGQAPLECNRCHRPRLFKLHERSA
jgi:uncharacterized NAD(P)/FAD-binding protein YdhS